MSDLPEPLVPADVDLREFPFMPLDVRRLRDSRFVAVRTAEEVVGGVLLWSASWHQQPASSVPDDDIELSSLAGYGGARGLKAFRAIRDGALHGFILCADGRWYHPVVAEKAAEAWNGRLEMEWRRAADRVRKENKERAERKEELLTLPARPQLLSIHRDDGIPYFKYTDSAGIPAERLRNSSLKGKGERKGQGKGDSGQGIGIATDSDESSVLKLVPAAPAARSRPVQKSPDESKTSPCWQAYSAAYRERYDGADPTRNAPANAAMARFVTLVPLEEAPAIAAFYVRHNKRWYVEHQHDVKYLAQDASGLRTQWLNGRTVTSTEAGQADRTQANGNVFHKLIEEAEHGQ